jgi:hypothetical protein
MKIEGKTIRSGFQIIKEDSIARTIPDKKIKHPAKIPPLFGSVYEKYQRVIPDIIEM